MSINNLFMFEKIQGKKIILTIKKNQHEYSSQFVKNIFIFSLR